LKAILRVLRFSFVSFVVKVLVLLLVVAPFRYAFFTNSVPFGLEEETQGSSGSPLRGHSSE